MKHEYLSVELDGEPVEIINGSPEVFFILQKFKENLKSKVLIKIGDKEELAELGKLEFKT